MTDQSEAPHPSASWREENEELRRQLEEAQQTLEAIRHGEVDALVVGGPQGEQVYSLSGAEHVYRVIVETMNEAALTLDPDGTILFCNRRFCDLLRTPMRDVMGHKLTTFAARPQQPSLETLVANAQAGPVQQRLTLRATDGTMVPVQLSASPLHAGDNISICLVVTDLTELEASAHSLRVLRQHEQEMQEANARLQTQSEELQIQAEELRTQTEELLVVEATLESKVSQRTAELKHRTRQLQKLALEMSEAEDRERERIAQILHDDLQQELAAAKFQLSIVRSRIKHDSYLREITAKMDEMLKDAISKSRNLSHELSPAALRQGDCTEILEWLATEMQARHGLTVRVQGRVHCLSDAIKAFLYRAAQELLFNAVKHAQVNEARVRVRQCGGYVCLAVSDRGRGFDPQQLREATGFGLLSIRERIELLGGRMKIRSAPGAGSTFFVVVPNGETAGEWGGPQRSPAEDRGRLRVLLADDHQLVRQGLMSLLSEEETVEVVGEAADGREAVDLAEQLHPDVVIMDMSMHVMSGDEATRRIKSQSPQTRVVALSMFEDAEVRDKMCQAGAESYVLKTAPSEELLAAIRGKAQR